ncbi:MAG TPA: hypothetical protein DCP28_35065 [Cytophagales bacterium]|nr:hypothetical protein [Cytophagales bacterium]
MVVKTVMWQNFAPSKLYYYIENGAKKNPKGMDFELYHNISGFGASDVMDTFKANEKYRNTSRSKNALIHDIISFSPEDEVSIDIARDLCQKYLELSYGEDAIHYARVHSHDKHLHIHIMTHNCRLMQSKSLRKSQEEFYAVRRVLEDYQKLQYPQLTHSLVYTEPVKEVEPELETSVLDRGSVIEKLQDWQRYMDYQSFLAKILQSDTLNLYYRAGRPYGVYWGDQKVRFKTAGIDVEAWQRADLLKSLAKRQQEVEKEDRERDK